MAERKDRLPNNAPGKFYVDSSCTDCDLCRQIAPDTFAYDDESAMTVVVRQPENDQERMAVWDAVESCPTSSIGDDGDSG